LQATSVSKKRPLVVDGSFVVQYENDSSAIKDMLQYANQQLNSAARTVTYAALQQRAGRSVKDPVGLLRDRNTGRFQFEAGAVHILLEGNKCASRTWQ
jgi:hypothetical protein